MKKVALIYGLGGAILDPAVGERYLSQRLKAAGFTVEIFNYEDSQGVYEFLREASWRGIVGDSFGADYGPLYASQMPLVIDYMAGFQPSMYATDVRNGQIMVPANVRVAHCIRDPIWLDTGGLGYATWVAAEPHKTRLLITEHRGAHPDDWGYSQDIVFDEIKRLSA